MGIAEILLEKGLITPADLAAALDLRKSDGIRLDRALVRLGIVSEKQLLQVMSDQLAIPMVDLTTADIDVDTLRSLPARLVYRKRLVPLSRENGAVTVATCDPFDLYAFDELQMMTGLEVRPALAPESDIDQVIKTYYGVAGDTIDAMTAGDDVEVIGETGDDNEDLLEMAQEASVIKLVNEILIEAVNERASDIHVEPYEKDLKIRYRIDGVLHETTVPPQIRKFQAAIISRIKIMAQLNIAEKRLPQDGRIKLQVGGRQIDIRVSVIPMLFGEGVVMRVLDKANVLFTLPQLGMAEDTYETFESLITRPHGIILVTGPTGSGKTTTLYAALQQVTSGSIKVLTVEDPVEYHLDGVNQIQVVPKIGMTFARGLRAILRHDPDVVMIGEIRDRETAEAAIQAALTGHLVLSTLHTNDSCSAATRLIDMGIEPFLVTSTLVGAMAQRLIRRVCPSCKTPVDPADVTLPGDFVMDSDTVLYRGVGCRECRQSGYRGRSGLYELMTMNDQIADRILNRATSNDIIRQAKATSTFRLLREDGWQRVREGVTTVDEVMRCT